MSIEHIDDIFVKKIPPAPINESIVGDGNRATIAFIRYLTDAYKSDRNIYEEVNKVISQVNLNIDGINSLQKELDSTQEGAGLSDDGSYESSEVSNYIDDASSLFDADLLLDTAIFKYTRELVSTASADTILYSYSQTLLCDATSGDINITMPNPSQCFGDNRSFRFAIHKIDDSENVINILPFDSELIVGEVNQTLELGGEIYNFITDGTNWYLGA